MVSFLVYSFLLYMGLNFILAGILSSCISLVFNFHTIAGFVFQDISYVRLLKFSLVFCLSIAINLTGIHVLSQAGLGYYLSAICVAGPVALITFVLNRQLVFRGSSSSR